MNIFFALLIVLFLTACSTVGIPPADAGMISLSWESPTTNEDGTLLADLAGFKIYCGTQKGGPYELFKIDVGNVNEYVIVPVEDGTYYCVGTAYNKPGTESELSNEVPKVVVNRPDPMKNYK